MKSRTSHHGGGRLFAAGLLLMAALVASQHVATAQARPAPKPAPTAPARPAPTPPAVPAATAVPPGYILGPDDVLNIVFWREKDMSGDVAVRPDGKISLPLLNDVQAAGLTPDQLRQSLTAAASKFFEDPNVTVVVKTINSRRVYITGEVAKPGPYILTAPITVLQLISMAGGLTEFAHSKDIRIMRTESGRQVSYPFNYKDVLKGKNLRQNIELKPNDTVVVP